MKKCKNCENDIKDDAKFCPKCGTKQTDADTGKENNQQDNLSKTESTRENEVVPENSSKNTSNKGQVSVDSLESTPVASKETDSPVDSYDDSKVSTPVEVAKNGASANSVADNEAVQQTIAASKGYFQYFLAKLKNPNSGIKYAHNYYGYVTYGLVAILFSWLLVLEVNRIAASFSSLLYEFGELMPYDGPGFSTWLRFAIIVLLFLAVPIGILFFTTKIIAKSSDSFHMVVNQTANFLYPALLVLGIAILLSIAGISNFSFSIVALILVASSASYGIFFVTYDYINASRTNISTFYILLASSLVAGIIDFILITLFGV